MKKGLMMLGAAVIALASCTQNEVMEVAESRAIGFDAFVGKTTKAVNDITTDKDNLTEFYVFGAYSDDGTIKGDPNVFDNVKVSGKPNWTTETTEYWISGKTYKFVAYSDGNTKCEKASFKDGAFAISDYTVDTKDLIASDVVEVEQDGKKLSPVSVSMKHLLAKVKFTITNGLAAGHTIEITGLQIADVPNQGKYENGAWAPLEGKKTYGFAFEDAIASAGNQASDEFYVMPQTTEGLAVTFTATVKDNNGVTVKTKPFNATIDVDWAKNSAYNYTLTLTLKDMELENNIIKFTPSVEDWSDYSDTASGIGGQI